MIKENNKEKKKKLFLNMKLKQSENVLNNVIYKNYYIIHLF